MPTTWLRGPCRIVATPLHNSAEAHGLTELAMTTTPVFSLEGGRDCGQIAYREAARQEQQP